MTDPAAGLAEPVRRLRTAVAALQDLRPAVEAGEPWPLADAFGAEPEASWGPRELLAHVTEMLPFWLGEIERILQGRPGEPVPFGRVQTDAVRIGLIGRDRTVPLRELYSRLAADGRRVADRLLELGPADAERRGLHPVRGEVSVQELAEQFIAAHLEGHVNQLREILAGG
jgi:hypothetical protein